MGFPAKSRLRMREIVMTVQEITQNAIILHRKQQTAASRKIKMEIKWKSEPEVVLAAILDSASAK